MAGSRFQWGMEVMILLREHLKVYGMGFLSNDITVKVILLIRYGKWLGARVNLKLTPCGELLGHILSYVDIIMLSV